MLEVLLKDDNWFLPTAGVSLVAAVVLVIGARRRRIAGRIAATGACNLFFGLMIGILGIGHLFAVTTKAILGILPPQIHLWFAIPFGLALAGPAWWLTMEVRGLVRENSVSVKRAKWLNGWLALVLASQGIAAVLAVPAGVNMLLLLLSRRSKPTPDI